MAFIGFRVTDQLAARFEAVAATRGGKSRVLRAMVEAVTRSPPGEGEGPGVSRGGSNKVTLRLKDEDLAALDAAAAEAGLRRTEWLVACARRRLTAKPQFSEAQALALLETRRELRRIGVNLRELARKMAEQDGATPADIAAIQSFQSEVRAQLEGVRAAIDGNLEFWESEA
ncbi:plasmid mobilization relaxosome protein MobC [Phenylobacterium sp. LjRoot219]|uniref:plasmid mobilization protein n=1 Tax=Phenylobacterium sp. LjRoot219 TaxID=3342283 RepID=UPI003ECF79BD